MKTRADRNKLAAMTLDEFRKLHPTVQPEVLEAMYDDRLVAFDEEVDAEIAALIPVCPSCGGPRQILPGYEDEPIHFRCRACGADTSKN